MNTLQFWSRHYNNYVPFFYTFLDYGGDLGIFINSINNLAGSLKKSTFWSLNIRTIEDVTCSLSVGASFYVPRAGDHVVFSFVKYGADVVNYPECDTLPDDTLEPREITDCPAYTLPISEPDPNDTSGRWKTYSDHSRRPTQSVLLPEVCEIFLLFCSRSFWYGRNSGCDKSWRVSGGESGEIDDEVTWLRKNPYNEDCLLQASSGHVPVDGEQIVVCWSDWKQKAVFWFL